MSQVLANRPPSLIHKHLHNICISQAFTLLLIIITRQITRLCLIHYFFLPCVSLSKNISSNICICWNITSDIILFLTQAVWNWLLVLFQLNVIFLINIVRLLMTKLKRVPEAAQTKYVLYEGGLYQNWQLSHHHLFRYREWANGSRVGGNQRGQKMSACSNLKDI